MRRHLLTSCFLFLCIPLFIAASSGCSSEESDTITSNAKNKPAAVVANQHQFTVGDHAFVESDTYICANRSEAVKAIDGSHDTEEYCYNITVTGLDVDIVVIDETDTHNVSKVILTQMRWLAWVNTSRLIPR